MALAGCPASPGAATELVQDAAGLQLGVSAFGRRAQLGVGLVGVVLGGRLVLPLAGRDHVVPGGPGSTSYPCATLLLVIFSTQRSFPAATGAGQPYLAR
jgi:hypothetical protein